MRLGIDQVAGNPAHYIKASPINQSIHLSVMVSTEAWWLAPLLQSCVVPGKSQQGPFCVEFPLRNPQKVICLYVALPFDHLETSGAEAPDV